MRGRCFMLLIAFTTCVLLVWLVFQHEEGSFVRTKIQPQHNLVGENNYHIRTEHLARIQMVDKLPEVQVTNSRPIQGESTILTRPDRTEPQLIIPSAAPTKLYNTSKDHLNKITPQAPDKSASFYRPQYAAQIINGVKGQNEEQGASSVPSGTPSGTLSSTIVNVGLQEREAGNTFQVGSLGADESQLSSHNVQALELAQHKQMNEQGGLSAEDDAQERKELAEWKRQQQQDIAEERRKIQEEQHRLLEEKIRFQKEVGEVMEEIRHGEMRDNMAGFLGMPSGKNNVTQVPDVDPKQWMGLNHTTVHQRYPEIVFNPQYKIQSFFAPEDPMASGMQGHPKSLNDLTDGQAEDRFYQMISQTQMNCDNIQRLGNLGDGGWDICVAKPYNLKPGCIIYSFGINFDFSFDDSIATKYSCEVRAFDPSMNTGDHAHSYLVYFYQLGLGSANTVNEQGWRLESLSNIKKKLNHLETPIDVIKMDIEHNEWECFQNMLQEGALRNVKQLIFELHTPEVYTVRRPSNKDDFVRMASLLRGLEEQGFRRYHFHFNAFGIYTSVRTGKSRTCCYELYYLNINFLN